MQKIAFENNLPETAFLLPSRGGYRLRWFTPSFEIDLCGHATLAAAFVLFYDVERRAESLRFETKSGVLTVCRREDKYEMLFPKRPVHRVEPAPAVIEALGAPPAELYGERDLYAVLRGEEEVRHFVPQYEKLAGLHDFLGVVVTAPGEDCDFVSRYFCPELRLEDPVTGSSHSSLIPFWGERLHKTQMLARQLSRRGGQLYCGLTSGGVTIAGEAVLYLKGRIELPAL